MARQRRQTGRADEYAEHGHRNPLVADASRQAAPEGANLEQRRRLFIPHSGTGSGGTTDLYNPYVPAKVVCYPCCQLSGGLSMASPLTLPAHSGQLDNVTEVAALSNGIAQRCCVVLCRLGYQQPSRTTSP
ncbi:MAG: hypothetical protein U0175_35690 [Caldilineaceae bacterium]